MVEKQKATHELTVSVPLVLHDGPFDNIVVADIAKAVLAVLSLLRVSDHVADDPHLTLEEVPADGVE